MILGIGGALSGCLTGTRAPTPLFVPFPEDGQYAEYRMSGGWLEAGHESYLAIFVFGSASVLGSQWTLASHRLVDVRSADTPQALQNAPPTRFVLNMTTGAEMLHRSGCSVTTERGCEQSEARAQAPSPPRPGLFGMAAAWGHDYALDSTLRRDYYYGPLRNTAAPLSYEVKFEGVVQADHDERLAMLIGGPVDPSQDRGNMSFVARWISGQAFPITFDVGMGSGGKQWDEPLHFERIRAESLEPLSRSPDLAQPTPPALQPWDSLFVPGWLESFNGVRFPPSAGWSVAQQDERIASWLAEHPEAFASHAYLFQPSDDSSVTSQFMRMVIDKIEIGLGTVGGDRLDTVIRRETWLGPDGQVLRSEDNVATVDVSKGEPMEDPRKRTPGWPSYADFQRWTCEVRLVCGSYFQVGFTVIPGVEEFYQMVWYKTEYGPSAGPSTLFCCRVLVRLPHVYVQDVHATPSAIEPFVGPSD